MSEVRSAENVVFGMRVIQSQYIPDREPVLKLRHDTPVRDAFRQDMDRWLLEQFGTQEVVYIMDTSALRGYFDRLTNSAFGIPERTLVGSTLTIDKLRAACKLVMT